MEKEQTGFIGAIKKWKAQHPDLYQFIAFNILSNCATITNFVVLWLSTMIFFKNITTPFKWWIFNYQDPSTGGLGGFYAFLLAYVCAQIVNYLVQKNLVFKATFGPKKLFWYIVTVVFAGIVSIWLPPYVIKVLSPIIHGFSATVANILNIVMQVIINWPMLKFVVMKD
ncbi:membrane protein [Lactobacillus psittaci]|uniref:GtrA-like protein domain-containing protein n=1 Tax=Lactobacillus psittaci DSM 15354 TaxID=1122152 RepID=A0A0R1SCV4_9LACO|nr:membrane protein [Lactobacillus psittaci]KRL63115.1 hypothetical protein FC23_GL001054 [Lactobacillus psittaci DSM 15354]